MVSPRPSCISWPVRTIVSPPSCRIAMSKETRVRVEGLSKIIASILPASGGSPAVRPRRDCFFIVRLASTMPRNSRAGMSISSRKCGCCCSLGRPLHLPMLPRLFEVRRCAIDPLNGFDDVRVGGNKWRKQAYDVVAGGGRQQSLGPQRVNKFSVWHLHTQSHQQSLAAQLADCRGMPIFDLGKTLLEQQRFASHFLEESGLEHY